MPVVAAVAVAAYAGVLFTVIVLPCRFGNLPARNA
jgi:hypothetical protein